MSANKIMKCSKHTMITREKLAKNKKVFCIEQRRDDNGHPRLT